MESLFNFNLYSYYNCHPSKNAMENFILRKVSHGKGYCPTDHIQDDIAAISLTNLILLHTISTQCTPSYSGPTFCVSLSPQQTIPKL